ncbi:hypothetical protein [Endozoicomonas ascidiicola]|uniref:hypothetical protein n=1 Tax=Endozoicomonas ascidiicola TaxID=1698521 RepID=UPI0008359B07|nr:hypothetical protein [Endozoicomonas ascidiicola]
MSIRKELINLLEDQKITAEKLNAILLYFGFIDSQLYTLEKIGEELGVTKQAVTAMISRKLISKQTLSLKIKINEFIGIVDSKNYWSINNLEEEMEIAMLINEDEFNITGIFLLIDKLGIKTNSKLCNINLDEQARNHDGSNRTEYIISKDFLETIKQKFNKALRLQGKCGIANLEYIKEYLGADYSLIKELLLKQPKLWTSGNLEDDTFYYLLENRESTIINYHKLVFKIIDRVNPEYLSELYHNAMFAGKKAEKRKEYTIPPKDVIQQYFESSKYFNNLNGMIIYTGDKKELSETNRLIVSFFNKTKTEVTFREIKDYLLESGISEDRINQMVTHSPIIYKNTSPGRKNYLYSLVSNNFPDHNNLELIDDFAEDTNELLQKISKNGTDKDTTTLRRLEHPALEKYLTKLYKNGLFSCCAICKKEFATTKEWIVAHKFKRKDCSDDIRTDVNIVMPLCIYGCDPLYEKGFIVINGNTGIVTTGERSNLSDYGNEYIDRIIGKKIDPIWMRGKSPTYFKEKFDEVNEKIKQSSK